ncbi:MAG TPA: transposase [bacterium]|jgi:putative transposase
MADKKKHGKRYSEEKILRVLKEVDVGRPISDVCREHGISDQTYRNWRRRYSGMEVADIREMRRLIVENGRLKKIVAEKELEIEAMKDVLSKKW